MCDRNRSEARNWYFNKLTAAVCRMPLAPLLYPPHLPFRRDSQVCVQDRTSQSDSMWPSAKLEIWRSCTVLGVQDAGWPLHHHRSVLVRHLPSRKLCTKPLVIVHNYIGKVPVILTHQLAQVKMKTRRACTTKCRSWELAAGSWLPFFQLVALGTTRNKWSTLDPCFTTSRYHLFHAPQLNKVSPVPTLLYTQQPLLLSGARR